VHERPAQQSLFYVLAFVPDAKPNEFFILTQAAANQGVQEEFGRRTFLATPGILARSIHALRCVVTVRVRLSTRSPDAEVGR
jgi:hypothetical protein